MKKLLTFLLVLLMLFGTVAPALAEWSEPNEAVVETMAEGATEEEAVVKDAAHHTQIRRRPHFDHPNRPARPTQEMPLGDGDATFTVSWGVVGEGGGLTATQPGPTGTEYGSTNLSSPSTLPFGSIVWFDALPYSGFRVSHWLVNGQIVDAAWLVANPDWHQSGVPVSRILDVHFLIENIHVEVVFDEGDIPGTIWFNLWIDNWAFPDSLGEMKISLYRDGVKVEIITTSADSWGRYVDFTSHEGGVFTITFDVGDAVYLADAHIWQQELEQYVPLPYSISDNIITIDFGYISIEDDWPLIFATFSFDLEREPVTVTFDSVGNGTISAQTWDSIADEWINLTSPAIRPFGEAIDFFAEPAPGHRVSHWLVNDERVDAEWLDTNWWWWMDTVLPHMLQLRGNVRENTRVQVVFEPGEVPPGATLHVGWWQTNHGLLAGTATVNFYRNNIQLETHVINLAAGGYAAVCPHPTWRLSRYDNALQPIHFRFFLEIC